ncbi:MAG: hypothetical protein CK427_06005 [Leptospira sp.]|nr:MAG: hypothetical protein CK427_06005 [Leptospira sp.]
MSQTSRYSILFILLYGLTTFAIWKRYNFNPTSMVNFGYEFATQNASETPKGSVVFQGEDGNLGAGYDGQIFYYFSRPISNFNLNWPVGFDESYRAPRIGYPFLIAIFGFIGQKSAIFGMYFLNISLLFISFLALRSILKPRVKNLSLLYLLSPFALGSYSVLVSDTVMVSLVVIAYFLFLKEKYISFSILAGLAILTKEPALFFLFPLGLKVLFEKDLRKILALASSLVIPILWQAYLKITFPNWSAMRLTDFILPLEGISSYFLEIQEFYIQLGGDGIGFGNLARLLGRFPLVILFVFGLSLLFSKNIQKGWNFRLAMLLSLFMVGTAGHYHFWSVYENISRMFTISIPILILWKNEDESLYTKPFVYLVYGILTLFIIKIFFVSKPLTSIIWD